jgi:hypothetical protein
VLNVRPTNRGTLVGRPEQVAAPALVKNNVETLDDFEPFIDEHQFARVYFHAEKPPAGG